MRELRPRRGERRLIGPRIDDEQQVALFDELAVLEMDFGQITADPRADLDIFLGGELPGVLVPLDELALDRLAHRHRRRGRGVRSVGQRRRAEERHKRGDEKKPGARMPCH